MGERDENPNEAGPVPKAPIREESITNFDKSAGDSSKALLVTVLVLVVAMLVGVFFCTEAPKV
jgi:hypothetical protein